MRRTATYGDELKGLASKRAISVEYDTNIAPALGVSSGGRIRWVPDLKPTEEFSVLAHELAHEMLYHRRSTARVRPSSCARRRPRRWLLLSATQLILKRAAADYITLYNGDKKTLADSLAVIQETSSQILDELFPERPRPIP